MSKLNLREKIINNMLFGKGKETCKALAVYLDKNDEEDYIHPLVALQFDITRVDEYNFKVEKDKYLYDALSTKCKINKYDDKVSSIISLHDNMKYDNMDCNMVVHIVYESTETADYIKYEYNTEFKTDMGNGVEEILMLNAEHGFADKDKEEKAHLILILMPMSKMVPIVVDLVSPEYRYTSNGNILQDNIYSDAKSIISKMAFITGEKSDPMYSVINFNSYTESFNTNSYQIKKINSFEDIKDRTFDDRCNELKYLIYDSFNKLDNGINYLNEKTHIGYTLSKKNGFNTLIYYINGIKFIASRYTDDGKFREYIRDSKYDNDHTILYKDFGKDKSTFNVFDEWPHMKKITEESELTKDELYILSHCEYDRIIYDGQYPYDNIPRIKEEEETEDISKYYSCLFPYIWIDTDNTGKVSERAVELFGIYPRENADPAEVSTLILDESLMEIVSKYSEGNTTHMYTQIFLKEDLENPVYSCHSIMESNMYASNVIEECDFGDNYKFRITYRSNVSMPGKPMTKIYSYESPELNITIDELNNKILDFSSSVYNRYFDDVVLVRDRYGCQQELVIKDLK